MRVLWLAAGLSLLSSICSALLADAYLAERIAIVGSFAGLEYSLNEGIAFGLRIPGALQFVFILAALCFVGWYALRDAETTLTQVGFGLILGGGIANVIDRLRDGFVTDYFQVGGFPIFNVADSCITVGIILLFLEMVVRKRKTAY